jgi:integrase
VLRYLATCPRKSFRNEIGLLSISFAHWMAEGILTFNPCFGVRTKRKGSQRDRLLLDAEIDAIVAKADERLAIAIELAYATGMRISDLCGLRWGDLAGPIRTMKTGVKHVIEDTEPLQEILARARALQSKVGSLYVLCNRGGRRWATESLRARWTAACQRAGIEDAHFHDLRAAAGTEVERQRGKRAAQAFLGHQDERTTERYLRDRRTVVITPLARKRG